MSEFDRQLQNREMFVRHFYKASTMRPGIKVVFHADKLKDKVLRQYGVIFVIFGRTYWFGRFLFYRPVKDQQEQGETE